jgi:hypothetical protein
MGDIYETRFYKSCGLGLGLRNPPSISLYEMKIYANTYMKVGLACNSRL